MEHTLNQIIAADGALIAGAADRAFILCPAVRRRRGEIRALIEPAIDRCLAYSKDLGQILLIGTEAAEDAGLTGEFGFVERGACHDGSLRAGTERLNRAIREK